MGIRDDESLRNSIKQADAYVALGCSSKSFTCAPYLLEKDDVTTDAGIPQKGDQIIWGESNAVVYANTVLGARTEKYADYLDICCAIVGKVPYLGVHLDEPRIPTMILEMDENVLEFMSQEDDLLFPVLGHLCGSLSDGEVPLLVGLEKYADRVTLDNLKAFCAAFGTTAASPLIHVAGITPEARLADIDAWKKSATRLRSISAKNLQETFDLLDQQKPHNKQDQNTVSGNNDDGNDDNTNDDKVDLVALGNPHLSLSEVDDLLRLVENRVALSEKNNSKKHDDVSILACISRALYDKSPNVKKLEDLGFIFVRDTCWCMLLEPPIIPSDPNATILTNSGKYAHYGKNNRLRFVVKMYCEKDTNLPHNGYKIKTTMLTRNNYRYGGFF
ncbi:MAG: putative aconitase [Bacillariaceae sp.]